MTALQTVNLGTAPAGTDGDPVRTAFTKANSNVVVLNGQAALTSAAATITTAQALTAALHVGKRVNISLASPGTINLPAASTCAADQVTLLRNIGTAIVTLAITTGSGDTVALSKLNPGETALMDTDGVHAWSVLMRGRTNSDNEVVNGNCAVNGSETVSGTLAVTGLCTFTGGASFGASGQATISAAGAYSGVGAAYSGNVSVGGTLGVTGQATFTLRPTFAGNTPWDSGNLSGLAGLPAIVSGAASQAAGKIGEFIEFSSTGTTAAANGAVYASAGKSLAPGVWDIQVVNKFAGSAAYTSIGAGVNLAQSSLGGLGTYTLINAPFAAGSASTVASPIVRISLSVATTVWAVATSVISSGTGTVDGYISARRVI